MMEFAMFVIGVVVIIAAVIGGCIAGADERFALAVACFIVAIGTAIVGGIWLVNGVQDQYTQYGERCRAAGGVPIRAGNSSLNCVDGSGRYLDVQW